MALLVVGACGRSSTAPSPQPAQFPGQPTPPEVDIDALLESLSLRDRIAQLVIPWIPGSYAAFDDEAFARMQVWVDSLHVGGLLVSVGSPLDVAAKLNRLQERSAVPLLVGSDLEAGTAIRLNGGTPFPPNMGIGATARDSDAYELGRITALEGRAVGIHLAFAPVADVNNNPANPIINVRSFGEDPQAVGRMVSAEVRGLQDNGMLATAKHFPGHGDTGTDSHLVLPVLFSNWARLDSVELVPFRSAIAAGVTAIMSAHIALPGMDGGLMRPGTVAPNILTGILRDSLGFKGLVITDALNMGGIGNVYGAEAGVRAFQAGADLLLQPADPAQAIDAMAAAIGRREITAERLNRSVRRVLELKRRLGLFIRRTVPLDSIPAVVGKAEFREEARAMASRSIVHGEGCEWPGVQPAAHPAAARHDHLRRGGQPIAGQRARVRAQDPGIFGDHVQAVARQRPGQLRFRRERDNPGLGGALRHLRPSHRSARQSRTAGLGHFPDLRYRSGSAHHPRVAGKSVSHQRPARGGLLSDRLALELRD